MVPKFKVIESIFAERFEEKLSAALADGWEIPTFGNAQFAVGSSDCVTYCLLLCKPRG
jgi:hypothetical protein